MGWVPTNPKFDHVAVAAIFTRVGEYFEYTEQLWELLAVVETAFQGIEFAHMVRVRAKQQARDWSVAEELQNRVFAARLEQARKISDEDYSRLNANSLLGLWGASEAAIEDIAALWFQAQNESLDSRELDRIKVPLGEFIRLNGADRARFVVRELQRSQASDARMGVGQFESMLAPLGLGGDVRDDTRRELLFAQQARHLIAHRGGIVDARFLETCNWLGLSAGDRLQIGRDQFMTFKAALCDYISSLASRVEIVTSQNSFYRQLFAEFRKRFPSADSLYAPETVALWRDSHGAAQASE